MHITTFKDAMSQRMFGREKSQSQKDSICVACGKPVEGFRDTLSKREYDISGLCQKCQDDVFDGD